MDRNTTIPASDTFDTTTKTLKYPRVLTIAGSDSGGGAGIQADIKAISATGSYAASAITAITVQNTEGVKAVHAVPVDILTGQIAAVLEDIGADAVKIGMLHNAEVVLAVKAELEKFGMRNIVLDPVMVATSGHRLIEESAIEVLSRELVPFARVITPNIPEAEILVGHKIHSQSDLPAVARELSCGGKVSVLMKAGHLTDDELVDIFYNAEEDHCIELRSRRIYSKNTHGTGCTLSSAFASFLARGFSLDDAARNAKDYINMAIASGATYEIGHGHGPVNHFFRLSASN
ncbi:MAG: bifunctional hydroxymethylpyrimidine kinase/phosphomethylpyrimidine kinase [Bacteroidales bacterium]|nr:bifunctional hydroxymethylpyrimidine kinase/phosphomethylpyrimidine kinase [Bacteroidales bacterium]